MHADHAVERRHNADRVPMDEVQVNLFSARYGDPVEADGVNVARGGLAVRGAYLPEVGDEMDCSFPVPGGDVINAGCEVVWAHDAGPYRGEFGLRFVDMPPEDAAAIAALVEAYRDSVAPPEVTPAPELRTTTLEIEGVKSPVMLDVAHTGEDALILEQALPFFRLGTAAASRHDGRVGQLSAVDLRLVDDTPRLVLTLTYEDQANPAAQQTEQVGVTQDVQDVQGAQEAQGAERSPIVAPRNASTAYTAAIEPVEPVESVERMELDTLPDADPPTEMAVATTAQSPAVLQPPTPAREAGERIVDPRIAHGPSDVEPPRGDAARCGELDADDLSIGFVSDATADSLAGVSSGTGFDSEVDSSALGQDSAVGLDADTPSARAAAALRAKTAHLLSQVRPLLARLRALVLAGLAKAKPAAKALLVKLRALPTALREGGLPRAKALFSRGQTAAKSLRGGNTAGKPRRQQRSRLARRGAPQVTPRRAARSQQERTKKRALVLSVMAFVLVALVVWALMPGADAEGATDDASAETAPIEDSAAVPSGSAVGAGASPHVAESAYVSPEPVPAAAPTPLPDLPPSPGRSAHDRDDESPEAGGQLAAPTYPSLGDARPQAPGSVPANSPYAEGGAEVEEGTQFGDDEVPRARSLDLRMSRRVQTLRGQRQDNGFTVVIPGSLAIDGAARFASRHPHVERSVIRNRGDHSVLTVRFVEGRTPAYRVEARGNSLHIEVAR